MSGVNNKDTNTNTNNRWPWGSLSDDIENVSNSNSRLPKISIVTPSYNQGQYIEETIRSVILQQYPQLQYIVIDGGSSDRTVDVLKRYDEWIDYWVSEPDEGQSHAINKGLARSNGAIWNWLNSDDLLEPGALHAIGRQFRSADVLLGRARHFTDEESYVKEPNVGDFGPEALLTATCQFSQEAVWLKTEKVKNLGGVDESFHYSMDRELYVRYTYHYPVVKGIDDILGRFRAHELSKSMRSGFDDLNNAFRRDYLQMARKLRRQNEYRELHDICDRRIEWLEWLLYIGELKEQDNRSTVIRLFELLGRTLKRPRTRMSRFTFGQALRLLKESSLPIV